MNNSNNICMLLLTLFAAELEVPTIDLAVRYFGGIEVPQNNARAYGMIIQFIHTDSEAMRILGGFYYTDGDFNEAAKCFREAIDMGNQAAVPDLELCLHAMRVKRVVTWSTIGIGLFLICYYRYQMELAFWQNALDPCSSVLMCPPIR